MFRIYDAPEPPNEGACVTYMLNRIVKRRRVFKSDEPPVPLANWGGGCLKPCEGALVAMPQRPS